MISTPNLPFIAILLTIILQWTSVAQSWAQTGMPYRGLPILQGYTTNTTASFTVLVPKNKPARYFVRSQQGEKSLELRNITVQHFERDHSEWAVDRLHVSGLRAQRPYTLEVRDVRGEPIDSREFYTLDLSRPRLFFAAASCLDQNFVPEQRTMWARLLKQKPQMIFLLGDNVYTTRRGDTRPQNIWQAYVQSRLTLGLYRSPKLIPTLAIWDDGDYGQSDGHRKYKFKSESAEVFQIFYPQEPDFKNLSSGPGTARFLTAFNMNFALMDNRYFRSPKSEDEDQTHWGAAQERWLIKNISESLRPTWIINGDQIFGGYHKFESYEGDHPNSLKKFLPLLSESSRPILFLTGDRHLSEIMKISEPQFHSYEITTSPLHAKTFPDPWIKSPNPRKVWGRFGALNFAMVRAESFGRSIKAEVVIYGQPAQNLFRYRIHLSGSPKNATGVNSEGEHKPVQVKAKLKKKKAKPQSKDKEVDKK